MYTNIFIHMYSYIYVYGGRRVCTLQHTETHCNALQHLATHCNTLQHTATHCNSDLQVPVFDGAEHFTFDDVTLKADVDLKADVEDNVAFKPASI